MAWWKWHRGDDQDRHSAGPAAMNVARSAECECVCGSALADEPIRGSQFDQRSGVIDVPRGVPQGRGNARLTPPTSKPTAPALPSATELDRRSASTPRTCLRIFAGE